MLFVSLRGRHEVLDDVRDRHRPSPRRSVLYAVHAYSWGEGPMCLVEYFRTCALQVHDLGWLYLGVARLVPACLGMSIWDMPYVPRYLCMYNNSVCPSLSVSVGV